MKKLSTSDQRRDVMIGSALCVFAKTGFLGTPIAAIARHAQVSPAYVFKLFPRKDDLFVAALNECFRLIQKTLSDGAAASPDQSPEGVLDSMGVAYAGLIQNRDLLMLQVHALSVVDVPEIGAAFRQGLQDIAMFVMHRSQASDESVQRFFAYGQLCHLISTLSLEGNDAAWARTLTSRLCHP